MRPDERSERREPSRTSSLGSTSRIDAPDQLCLARPEFFDPLPETWAASINSRSAGFALRDARLAASVACHSAKYGTLEHDGERALQARITSYHPTQAFGLGCRNRALQ